LRTPAAVTSIPQDAGRLLGRLQEREVCQDVRIMKNRGTTHVGRNLSQHFEPLAADRRFISLESGDVSTWPR
jgi:hypothetical protein